MLEPIMPIFKNNSLGQESININALLAWKNINNVFSTMKKD